MCGIATATRRFVETVAGTGCRILDTRKTAPGLRMHISPSFGRGRAVDGDIAEMARDWPFFANSSRASAFPGRGRQMLPTS